MTENVKVISLTVGLISTNCYLVYDSGTGFAAVIDPGAESSRILSVILENNLTVKCILLTHTHFDHITAVPNIAQAFSCPIYVGEKEDTDKLQPQESVVFVREGDVISDCGFIFEVIDTPGHTPGGITYKLGSILFTGDTLFKESMGRTDAGGSTEAILESLIKLASYPDECAVLPGHAEESTIGYEKEYNYYMRYALGAHPAQVDLDEE